MAFEIENNVLKKYIPEEGETEVVIPEGVTKIGSSAFWRCSLMGVRIPEGVTGIGSGAFFECENLESVTFPGSMRSIAESAFEMCHLRHVFISDHIIYIAGSSFGNCRPDTVTIQGITFVPKKINGRDFHLAIEMLKRRNFDIRMNTGMKYAAVTGFYLNTNDADAEAFVKKNRSKILPFLIENGCADAIHKLLESGKFVTKRNIDQCIALAIEQENTEIRMELLHYKSERLGYKNIAETFKL